MVKSCASRDHSRYNVCAVPDWFLIEIRALIRQLIMRFYRKNDVTTVHIYFSRGQGYGWRAGSGLFSHVSFV